MGFIETAKERLSELKMNLDAFRDAFRSTQERSQSETYRSAPPLADFSHRANDESRAQLDTRRDARDFLRELAQSYQKSAERLMNEDKKGEAYHHYIISDEYLQIMELVNPSATLTVGQAVKVETLIYQMGSGHPKPFRNGIEQELTRLQIATYINSCSGQRAALRVPSL